MVRYQLPQRRALQPNSFLPELCWAGQQVATIDISFDLEMSSTSFKVAVSEKVILIGLDGGSSLKVKAAAVGGAVNVPLGISTSIVGEDSFSWMEAWVGSVFCCELGIWTWVDSHHPSSVILSRGISYETSVDPTLLGTRYWTSWWYFSISTKVDLSR